MRPSLLTLFLLFISTPALGADKIKLGLNWKPEPQFGGFYAARDKGFFQKKKLDVEILPGGAGTPVVQMVAAGQIDYGIVSADEVVISRSRGSDVVALFATYQTSPTGVMVHEEAGLQSMKDVFGAPTTVALEKGLPYVSYLLKKFGPIKARIVPYTGGIAPFMANKKFAQQCFVTSEPIAARGKGLKPKVFLVADEGYNPYTTVLVTRMEIYKKNPQQVKSMVEAVREGWKSYLDDPSDINKKMSQINKAMDLETFIESSKVQRSLIETKETKEFGLGKMTQNRWFTLVDQLFSLNLIKQRPDPSGLFLDL